MTDDYIPRLHLARHRARELLTSAIKAISATDPPILIIARARRIRDYAEAVWMIDEEIFARTPIVCEEDHWIDA